MIGIYGGTFDPFHLGHAHVVRWLTTNCKGVIVVPAYQNPLKAAGAAAREARLAMIRLGISELGLQSVEISPIECLSEKPSYTIDTVSFLKQRLCEPIAIVVGSDAAGSFHQWKDYRQLLEMTDLWVMLRSPFNFSAWAESLGLPEPIANTITLSGGHCVRLFDIQALDISATRLRDDIINFWHGNQISSEPRGIQRSVWLFIKENGLYADCENRGDQGGESS